MSCAYTCELPESAPMAFHYTEDEGGRQDHLSPCYHLSLFVERLFARDATAFFCSDISSSPSVSPPPLTLTAVRMTFYLAAQTSLPLLPENVDSTRRAAMFGLSWSKRAITGQGSETHKNQLFVFCVGVFEKPRDLQSQQEPNTSKRHEKTNPDLTQVSFLHSLLRYVVNRYGCC